ncbi:MAG: hypothetical protein Q9162_002664 [Coniocarpon cinnabarinum]
MTVNKSLHWTQRLALVQHNLHAASRTGNFNFFSNLQSAHYLHGTDYIARLNVSLDGEADKLIAVLDSLNSGIAWSHEEAFKTVHDGLKEAASSVDATEEDGEMHQQSLHDRLNANITAQRAYADGTIDKLMSTASTQIQQQPLHVQEDAAMAFMLGTTFIADAVQVCLDQLNTLESCSQDVIMARADSAYALVRFAVSAAVSALKGVLNMMELHDDAVGQAMRRASVVSNSSITGSAGSRTRATSHTSNESASGQVFNPSSSNSVQLNGNVPGGGWNVFRRMSTALAGSSGPRSRSNSVSSANSTAGNPSSTPVHVSMASGPPPVSSQGKTPPNKHKRVVSAPVPPHMRGHVLSPIIGTPAPDGSELKNPFESAFAPPPAPMGNQTTPTQDNSIAWRTNAANDTRSLAALRSANPSPSTVDDKSSYLTANADGNTSPTSLEHPLGNKATEPQLLAPQPISPVEHITFVDPLRQSASQAKDDASKAERNLSDGSIRHGRRRSEEVREEPPELERLRMCAAEGSISL